MNEEEKGHYLGIDGMKWAEEFCNVLSWQLNMDIKSKLGLDLLNAWFSTAIMAGYDYRDKQLRKRSDIPEYRGSESPALRGERPVVSYETPD